MPMVGSTMSFLLNRKEKKMTSTLTLRNLDLPSVHKFGIGFDSIFDELQRVTSLNRDTNYPPYNIVKHSEDKFTIELAVAGFKDGDVSIEVEKNQLTITGEQKVDIDNPVEYLHRGISARHFVRTFTLADHVEVLSAEVANGILSVVLERRIPEEQKPKKIAINFNK